MDVVQFYCSFFFRRLFFSFGLIKNNSPKSLGTPATVISFNSMVHQSGSSFCRGYFQSYFVTIPPLVDT